MLSPHPLCKHQLQSQYEMSLLYPELEEFDDLTIRRDEIIDTSLADLFRSLFFFFSSRRRHTRYWRDWSSDVCSSDLLPENLSTTLRMLDRLDSAKRFYDVNLRTGHWHVAAVTELAQQATVTKLNHVEVRILALDLWGEETIAQDEFCRRWQQEFGCPVVCITCAEDGCAIYRDGEFVAVAGYEVEVADTVGAGDAFAAAFLHGLEQRWELREVGRFSNAAGAVVASRAGATPEWNLLEVEALAASAPLASA